ncbi:MAG TPA: lysophospholipid acyltransferase family protein [Nocardioidaceae bacterium]|nr:lysophospholipid acyltransferase family protein [Nocardioidaceae bacterium]
MSARRVVRGGVDDVRLMARGWRWGRRSMVPRSAEPYVDVPESSVFPTVWSRRAPVRVVREIAQKGALEPLLRSQVRPRVTGLDVLDGLSGPVVFVSNHASHLDTPLILLSLPDAWRRRTAVAAAADYFFDTWWRAVGSAVLFNTFPIERRGGALATTPGALIADGWNLVVYPEGTRSPDGWMRPFRMGAAWLAVTHQVPVVPVAHRGTFAAMPRGQSWPGAGRRTVTLRFGAPLRPEPGETARQFAPRVRGAVAALLDEETSSWWEARRHSVRGETPDPAGPAVAQWRRVWEQSASPGVAANDGRPPRRAWSGRSRRSHSAP